MGGRVRLRSTARSAAKARVAVRRDFELNPHPCLFRSECVSYRRALLLLYAWQTVVQRQLNFSSTAGTPLEAPQGNFRLSNFLVQHGTYIHSVAEATAALSDPTKYSHSYPASAVQNTLLMFLASVIGLYPSQHTSNSPAG